MKHNRKITDQQVELLVDNIRKIHISQEGLSKRAVAERAFHESFGDKWPIQAASSTISRYWRLAFPSEKPLISLPKAKKKRSPVAPVMKPPSVPMVNQSNTQVMMCPKCHCRFAITIFEG